MSAFEHDDFVLVGAVVEDVAQGQQRWRVGEDGVTPGRIALVGNYQRSLVSRDGRVQHAAERGDRRGGGEYNKTFYYDLTARILP